MGGGGGCAGGGTDGSESVQHPLHTLASIQPRASAISVTAVQDALISTEHEKNPPLVLLHALSHEAGISSAGGADGGGMKGQGSMGTKFGV